MTASYLLNFKVVRVDIEMHKVLSSDSCIIYNLSKYTLICDPVNAGKSSLSFKSLFFGNLVQKIYLGFLKKYPSFERPCKSELC